MRGEDPVFVVTGRKEDVAAAQREIVSAAEHFSQIRAQRKNNSLTSLAPGPPSPTTPGHTTISVRVPYRVVGLVVGPKGATIKRIQQQTNTYIVTPSRDKEPVFEVTGLPENVESARTEILNHISMRTGGLLDGGNEDSLFHNGDTVHGSFSDFRPGSIYSSGSSFSTLRDPSSLGQGSQRAGSDSFYFSNGNSSNISANDGFNPINSPFSANGFFFNEFSDLPSPSDRDVGSEGSSNSSGFEPTPPSPSIWASGTASRIIGDQVPFTRSSSLNGPSLSNAVGRPSSPHSAARRLKSDPLAGTFSALQAFTPYTTQPTSSVNVVSTATVTNGTTSQTTQASGISAIGTRPSSAGGETNNNTPTNMKGQKKECIICYESEVVAALVPCGHNLFCMECANHIKEENTSCPVCQKEVKHVLRIFS